MGMAPSCYCICPGSGGGGSPGSGGSGSGSGGGGGIFYGTTKTCSSCVGTIAREWYRIDITASGGTCVGQYNKSFYVKWSTFYGPTRCFWTSRLGSGETLINHRLSGCTATNTNLGRIELFKYYPAADGEHAWYLWVLWATSAINSFVLADYKWSNGSTAFDCEQARTLSLVSGGSDASAHGGTLTLGATCTLTPI